ncbi:flagellar biosynthesis anti-sigma factor FlgM [Kosakonia sp. H02]|nr:flagellar biosynthesis anti-sigma factor FlgM [Kosakonia sp. H02]
MTSSLLKQAQAALDALPEVDLQKVEAIRAALNNGEITVDIDALVHAMRTFHQR